MGRRISPGSRGQSAGRREQRRTPASTRETGVQIYKKKTATSFPMGIYFAISSHTASLLSTDFPVYLQGYFIKENGHDYRLLVCPYCRYFALYLRR